MTEVGHFKINVNTKHVNIFAKRRKQKKENGGQKQTRNATQCFID